jgi:hypothetical protein
MKYFVLNPTSSDAAFAEASRAAMLAFAESIKAHNMQLAFDLTNWAVTAAVEQMAARG